MSLLLLGNYRMLTFLTICLHTAFPEGTSGCLRSTRRPCTSGTQTSALKGRTIFLYPSTGKKKMSVCLVTSGLYPALLKLPEISYDSIEEMEFWCSQLYLTMDLSGKIWASYYLVWIIINCILYCVLFELPLEFF